MCSCQYLVRPLLHITQQIGKCTGDIVEAICHPLMLILGVQIDPHRQIAATNTARTGGKCLDIIYRREIGPDLDIADHH